MKTEILAKTVIPNVGDCFKIKEVDGVYIRCDDALGNRAFDRPEKLPKEKIFGYCLTFNSVYCFCAQTTQFVLLRPVGGVMRFEEIKA